MTLVIKNDFKSAKNSLKTQEKTFQLKKLACPVMITKERRNKQGSVY